MNDRGRPTEAELIAVGLATARAEAIASRDKEWAAAFHRGDWFEDEPDMTLEAFQKHGDNRRGSLNEVARISYEQGLKEGALRADAATRLVTDHGARLLSVLDMALKSDGFRREYGGLDAHEKDAVEALRALKG